MEHYHQHLISGNGKLTTLACILHYCYKKCQSGSPALKNAPEHHSSPPWLTVALYIL